MDPKHMLRKSNLSSVFVYLLYFGLLFSFTLLSLVYVTRSYNDYVYGKFDLGNINQMLYNTSRGDFMQLTDQFGHNVSRFSMSHVDPSIAILVPFNLIYSDAYGLLVIFCLLFTISSILLFLIARNLGLSPMLSALCAISIYTFPISGYILVWTGFRPLALAMPFLLLAYYLMQRLNSYIKQNKLNRKQLVIYWLGIIFSIFIVVMSKEEMGIVVFFFLPHLYYKFKEIRKGLIVIAVLSIFWSLYAFLVIIPAYEYQRIGSLNSFFEYIQITPSFSAQSLQSSNFFLHRYEQFGGSYSEILLNIVKEPFEVIKLIFSREILLTYRSLFLPILFSIFTTPLIFLAAVPEILIHSLSGDGDIFSIQNHRLFILIPLFALSIIYVTKYLSFKKNYLGHIYIVCVLTCSIVYSIFIKSPLLYPVYKAFNPVDFVFADTKNFETEWNYNLDVSCADYIFSKISPTDKVSVPQFLGAKTSNREFNALFPTGFADADLVVTDVLARKIVDFLQIDTKYNKTAVNKYITGSNVEIIGSCNRLSAIQKSGSDSNYFIESTPIPVDTIFDYVYSLKNGDTLFNLKSVDVKKLESGEVAFKYSYQYTNENASYNDFAYTIVTNGADTWVITHFPSFYLGYLEKPTGSNVINESFILDVPDYIPLGKDYSVYFGIGNNSITKYNLRVGELKL